jgi:hypothetical protein
MTNPAIAFRNFAKATEDEIFKSTTTTNILVFAVGRQSSEGVHKFTENPEQTSKF